MTKKDSLTIINLFHNDLKIVKEFVYDKCGFNLTNFKQNSESLEYRACRFLLNGNVVEYRASKITPTKTGQFVTIWKRNKDGITKAFDIVDDLDFIVISARSGNNLGQFIFPKSILADQGILTKNGKEGKRGIRVYPPWDIVTNKQAEKTQNWQTKYFFSIKNDNSNNLGFIRQLFTKAISID